MPPLQPEVQLFTRTPQAPTGRRPPTPYPRHPQLDPSSPSSTSHRTPSSQHSSNTYQQVSAPSRILRSSSLSTRQATPRPARAAAAGAAAQYPTSLGSPQPSIAGSHRVIVGSPITSGRQQSTITYQPLVAPPQLPPQLQQPPSRRPSATSYHDPPSSDVRSNLHSGPSSSHYSPTGSSGPLYWYQTPESQGKPSPELERGFVPPHPDDARRAAEYERWAAKVREENRRSGWRPGR